MHMMMRFKSCRDSMAQKERKGTKASQELCLVRLNCTVNANVMGNNYIKNNKINYDVLTIHSD
jgi:hypothetical protein